jgi:hypothetical protein
MADPYADLTVKISDRPIYCMGVRGALSPGNWVLFKNSTLESQEIGLTLSTSEDGDSLEVNIFHRVTPEMTRELRLPTINNPRYSHIPQIVRSASRVWIDMLRVKSICWVFKRETLDAPPTKVIKGWLIFSC